MSLNGEGGPRFPRSKKPLDWSDRRKAFELGKVVERARAERAKQHTAPPPERKAEGQPEREAED